WGGLLCAGASGCASGREGPARGPARGPSDRGSGPDRPRRQPQDRGALRPDGAAQDPSPRGNGRAMSGQGWRSRLLPQYVGVLLLLVGGVLLLSSLIELYFTYRVTLVALAEILLVVSVT